MAKPSWCLLVITIYFIPASCAICTHSSALNFTGLNCFASCSYSFTGILARFMIHSPMPAMGFPFHSPAGIAYRPQWMKRPNLASRNHFIFASWEVGADCAAAARIAKAATSRPTAAAAVRRPDFMLMIEILSGCLRLQYEKHPDAESIHAEGDRAGD